MNTTSPFWRDSILAFSVAALFTISPAHSEILTGGIGEDFAAIAAHTKEYPLRIAFSEGHGGAYVTDVTLNIYDKQKNLVLVKEGVGPIALVNLPDGEYKVIATYQGQKRSQITAIKKGEHKRLYFNWAGTDDSNGESSRTAKDDDTTP
jgi:hypothetical protein